MISCSHPLSYSVPTLYHQKGDFTDTLELAIQIPDSILMSFQQLPTEAAFNSSAPEKLRVLGFIYTCFQQLPKEAAFNSSALHQRSSGFQDSSIPASSSSLQKQPSTVLLQTALCSKDSAIPAVEKLPKSPYSN